MTTIMSRHQRRVIQCSNSGLLFTEQNNHAMKDRYHPGRYEVACPHSCSHCDTNGTPTMKCAAWRSKRWTCCDERKEGCHGDNGCAFRFKIRAWACGLLLDSNGRIFCPQLLVLLLLSSVIIHNAVTSHLLIHVFCVFI